MLKVSEWCNQSLRLYGLSEWDARSVYTKSDKRSAFPQGGQEGTTIVVERTIDGRRFVAVVGDAQKTGLVMLCVMRVPDSILVHETAIETLSAMCDAYGIPIGPNDAKLIIEEEIDVGGRVSPERIRGLVQFPKNHACSALLPFKTVGPRTVLIRFGFAIDHTEVLKDL